jgi:hypothetical protein
VKMKCDYGKKDLALKFHANVSSANHDLVQYSNDSPSIVN